MKKISFLEFAVKTKKIQNMRKLFLIACLLFVASKINDVLDNGIDYEKYLENQTDVIFGKSSLYPSEMKIIKNYKEHLLNLWNKLF